MDVQTSTGAVLLAAIPVDAMDGSCTYCVFGAAPDECRQVKCHGVLWGTRETFNEYLQLKLLK